MNELLAAVEQSPTAAAAHDRAGWVSLFAPSGRVEDPVGSRPHVGAAQIGRFYDTFIDPREITFHRDLDIVSDTAVIRDLQLEVAMGPTVTMHIPAILRYDLVRTGGAWTFDRLRAYWELPAMMRQFLGNGAGAVPAAVQLSKSLLSNQGVVGTIGFTTGFRRPGARSKRAVHTFLTAAAAGDRAAAAQVLAPRATLTQCDAAVDVDELCAQLSGSHATKVIGAGSTIAVSLATQQHRSVLFAEMGRGNKIGGLRYFPAH